MKRYGLFSRYIRRETNKTNEKKERRESNVKVEMKS